MCHKLVRIGRGPRIGVVDQAERAVGSSWLRQLAS
jgi:hypothetical protein